MQGRLYSPTLPKMRRIYTVPESVPGVAEIIDAFECAKLKESLTPIPTTKRNFGATTPVSRYFPISMLEKVPLTHP